MGTADRGPWSAGRDSIVIFQVVPCASMIETSGNMTTFVDVSDQQPLFGGKTRGKCSKTCLSIVVLGVLVFIGIMMAGYSMYWNDVLGVRVMSLNTWGMPHSMSSEDKEERMAAIGELLSQSEYYMTEYDDLTTSCDGKIWPWGCSGLAVISKFPFQQKNFSRFSQQGAFGQIFADGEYFAGKGVGKVTLAPRPGM